MSTAFRRMTLCDLRISGGLFQFFPNNILNLPSFNSTKQPYLMDHECGAYVLKGAVTACTSQRQDS